MAEKLKSRKFWVMIFITLLLTMNQQLSIFDDTTAKEITAVISVYLLGQGIADVKKS